MKLLVSIFFLLGSLSTRASDVILVQPQSRTVCPNQEINLSVEVSSECNVTYQWYRNGDPISGKTAPSFSFQVGTESAYYHVKLGGSCGTIESDSAFIQVSPDISILTEPQGATLCLGASHTFSVRAENASSYQWYKNGNPIVGATSSSYEIPAAVDTSAGEYYVKMLGHADCGFEKSSAAVQLSITPTVRVTVVSGNTVLCEGTSTALQVENMGGGQITWFKNHVSLGQHANVLEISAPVNGDSYYAQVVGACNTVESDTVALQVTPNIRIQTEPQGAELCLGASHTFSVTAENATSYQWYKNGKLIGGATAASYEITAAVDTSAGEYYVKIGGHADCGFEKSSAAVQLSISPTVRVTDVSGTVALCEGTSTALQVENMGGGQITWFKNHVSLGEHTNVLEISAPVNGDRYHAQVVGACNTVESDTVTLQVTPNIRIQTEPQGATLCLGQNHTFSVRAENATSYQWYKNGKAIAGATAATYEIPAAVDTSAGEYYVKIGGNAACGFEKSSASVQLSISPTVRVTDVSVNTVLCEGTSTALQVENMGGGQITWFKNHVSLGQHANVLAISAPVHGDRYHAQLVGACNTVESDTVALQVTPNIRIQTEPQGATLCLGQNHTFSVTAENASSYQWYKNGKLIAGATASTYEITAAVDTSAGEYYVKIGGNAACGFEMSSAAVQLSITPTVRVTDVSGTVALCEGTPTALQVENIGGGQITWFKNHVSLGQHANVLEISAPVHGDRYHAQVVGACNTVESDTVALQVTPNIRIQTEPQGATLCLGQNHTFSVRAENATSYQWYKNGNPIVGATSSSYEITAAVDTSAGEYYVKIGGNAACGFEKSSAAVQLSITPTVRVTDVSGNTVLCEGTPTALQVENMGGGQITWFKNHVSLGQHANVLEISAPVNDDSYYAQVVGACNTVETDTVALQVTPNIRIQTEPQGATLCLGRSHTFSVTAENATSYQWYKNGKLIAGATASTYEITAAVDTSAGEYYVKIGGHAACGFEKSSAAVQLSITPTVRVTDVSGTVALCEGTPTALQVENMGGGQITWFKNHVSLGEHANVLEISAPVNGDSYYAQVVGACNTVESDTVALQVTPNIRIQTEPQGATLCLGQNYTFSVRAENATSYQWYKNGKLIAGATAATFEISAAVDTSAGEYYVKILGHAACGFEKSSAAVQLSITPTVRVTDVSGNTVLCEGTPTALQVENTGGGQITWFKNHVSLGQHANVLEISAPVNGDSYYAQVVGTCNTVESDTVALQVTPNVRIQTEPQGATLCLGQDHTFSVTAENASSYQWYKNGKAIAGATASTYEITAAVDTSAGEYKVSVFGSSPCNFQIMSATATLSIQAQINISSVSGNTVLCEGTSTALQVENTSGGQITWFKNHVSLGQHANVLEISAPVHGDRYHAQAVGTCNTVESDTVTLQVSPDIKILTAPQGAELCLGASHTFSVTAENASSYQWYKNGNPIVGATSSSYVIPAAVDTSAGEYKVKISGACHSALVASQNALLSVEVGPQIVNQSDTLMAYSNSEITLSVSVEGSYSAIKWYKNDMLTALQGPTATFSQVALSDQFYALVESSCGNVKSKRFRFLGISSSKPWGICAGESSILSLTGCTDAVRWWFEGETRGTEAQYTAAHVGTYTAQCVQGSLVLGQLEIQVAAISEIDHQVSVQQVACYGAATGAVQLTGIPEGVQVLWLTPNQTPAQLPAGKYTYKLIHPGGCEFTYEIEIEQPLNTPVSLEVRDLTCFGNNSGEIDIYATGTGLQYFLNGVQGFWTNGQIRGLGAGTYTVEVKDAKACILLASTEVVVNAPPLLQVAEVQISSPKGYHTQDGSIQVALIGGTAPLTYAWYDAQGLPIGNNSGSIYGLAQGHYHLKVQDAQGCGWEQSYAVTAPEALALGLELGAISCAGIADGTLSVQVAGGVKPYQVSWKKEGASLDESGFTLHHLSAGVYTVQVIDAHGVSTEKTVAMTAPPALSVTVPRINHNYCEDKGVGEIEWQGNGGALPYVYTFNSQPVTAPQMAQLNAGEYLLGVQDARGCSAERSVTLANQPADFQVQVNYKAPSCYGACDGTLTASLQGGLAPYTFQWSGFTHSTQDLTGVCAGGETYLTVRDSRGCALRSDTLVMQGPAPQQLALPPVLEVCPTNFELDASSLTWGKGFTWIFPDGSTRSGAKVKGASLGQYTVQVLGENACGGTATIEVKAPQNVQLAFAMPPKAEINKEVVMVDLSEPYPSHLEWVLPNSASVKAQGDFELRALFSQAGTFTVEQKATIGGCVYSTFKEIQILDVWVDDGFSPAHGSLDFHIKGNPTLSSLVKLEITNEAEQDFTITVFEAAGFRKVFEQRFKSQKIVEINLPKESAGGLFYVTMESADSRKTKKLVQIR